MSCPADGVLSGAWMPPFNLLTNPGFNFNQLHDPASGTYTTITDAAVAADGWRVTRENADVQYSRVTNSGIFNSTHRGSFRKITSAGKIMIYQPLESLLSAGLGGNAYTIIVNVNLPVSYDFHIALLQWTGTVNVMTAPVSTWNAAGTQPTLNTNWSFVHDDIISGPPTGASGYFDERFAPGSASGNLAVAIYTDGHVAANDVFEIAEMGLYMGFGGRFTWTPLLPDEDLARCERFIEKTYAPDTLLATTSATDSIQMRQITTAHIEAVKYRTRKVVTPAITFYSPNDGSTGKWYDATGLTNLTMTANDIGTGGFSAQASSGTVGNVLQGHLLIDGSI